MVLSLITNQSMERILLFLLVNQTGYPSQMRACFQCALAPLQQALAKLEEHEIVYSTMQLNKRFYSLNTEHPLYLELEALLKKSYMLLPIQEKTRYYYTREKKQPQAQAEIKELTQVFKKLKNVGTLSLQTTSRIGKNVETKKGHALVLAQAKADDEIVFIEKGSWDLGPGPATSFSNTFRWTLHRDRALIALEHLRYGENHPVHLFDLKLSKPNLFESQVAHECGADTYVGRLHWSSQGMELAVRVLGPGKNILLEYVYQ